MNTFDFLLCMTFLILGVSGIGCVVNSRVFKF